MGTLIGSKLSGAERQIDRLARKFNEIFVAMKILVEYLASSDRSKEAGLPDFKNAVSIILTVAIVLTISGLVRSC